MPDDKTHAHTSPAPTLRPRRLATCSRAAALAVIACVCTTTAHAQEGRRPTVVDQTETSAAPTQAKPASATSLPNADPNVTRAVRERRVGAQPSAPTTDAKDASPASTASPASHDEALSKANSPASESPSANADAELETLRAQIIAAKTDLDRTRLQRTLADRLVELNRGTDAVTVLRAMLREERFDPTGFYNIGNALARLDDSQAAAEAYRKAIAQKNGNYSRAQNNLGVVLIRLGHWDEALEALTAALRLENGSYAEASYNVGRVYALRGEAGLAINEWQRTLTLQPDHADAAIALARAYAEEGEAQRGLKVLDNFTARLTRLGANSPRSITVARGEIVAANNISDSGRSVAIAADERSLDASTKNAPTSSMKTANAVLGSAPRAEAPRSSSSSNSASKLRPLAVSQQTYELLQRARVARESGEAEQAVALYRRVLSQQGGYFPPANLELGYALTTLKRTDEALATFLAVATKDGARYPVAFYHLGRLYEREGKLDSAAEAFTRAAALYGDSNPQTLLDISRVREKEGNFQAALIAMENYVRAIERLGSTPDWARDRLTQLRQKTSAAPSNPTPKQ
jgi:tetratricopeptide (TPR) repeat protein